MNKRLLTILFAITAFALLAQPQVIIKQKAKDLRDANNATQAGQQPAPRQTPQQPSVATPAPKIALSTQQESVINQIINELDKIEPSTQIDSALTGNIRKKLASLVQTPVNIKSDNLDKLAEQLATIWQKHKLNGETAQTVLKYTTLILNGTNLSNQSLNALLFNIQKQLTSAGVTAEEARALENILKTLFAEIKK